MGFINLRYKTDPSNDISSGKIQWCLSVITIFGFIYDANNSFLC